MESSCQPLSSSSSDSDTAEELMQNQRFIDLPMVNSPCPEALLSLAAGSVLSVLQCPPPPPMFRTSALFCQSPCMRPSSSASSSVSSSCSSSTATSPSTPASIPSAAASAAAAAGGGAVGAHGEQEPSLIHFLRNICIKASVTELALVISLIYIDRLKKALKNMARGDPDTPFKIILSALLVVKKFIEEDCVGLNRMFSKITDGLYSVHDINAMERSFLGLLKFSLYVTEKDVVNFIQSHQQELQGVEILGNMFNKPATAA